MPRKARYDAYPPVQRADRLKPRQFKNYLTLGELSAVTGKDKAWLRKLEALGRIPEGVRHNVGQLSVRLYSPSKVEEIKRILATHRVGRPRKDAEQR